MTVDTCHAYKVYRVEAFAIEPLAAERGGREEDRRRRCGRSGIQRAVARSGTKTKRAAVAVSGSAVITKVIAMTASLSDAEMETADPARGRPVHPLSARRGQYRLRCARPNLGNADMVDVLLAASRRENVDDRVAALEMAGLGAEIVDVEAYAMENACTLLLGRFDDERHDQTVAVADVGATTTTLHVLHDGKTVYTREQNFGGNQLLDEIQRRYGLSQAGAGAARGRHACRRISRPTCWGRSRRRWRSRSPRVAVLLFREQLQPHRSGHSGRRRRRIENIDELVESASVSRSPIAESRSPDGLGARGRCQRAERAAPQMMIATGLALRAFD
jgi:type IV pilus assembly protein PilM